MKLNLLPTHVSKEGATRNAIIVMSVIALAGIAAAIFMWTSSSKALADAKAAAEEVRPQAEMAVVEAKKADTIIAMATGLDRNVMLSRAMDSHNDDYVNLYREVLTYLPGFFRVTGISATPNGPTACNVRINGVIQSFQQYADLMLALLRIPGAQAVTREGYQLNDPYVPSLNTDDQIGAPIRPGEVRLPADPMARLQAVLDGAFATDSSFTGTGNFGTEGNLVRGASPGSSQITVTVAIANKALQTPNPRATLSQPAGSAPAGAPPTGGGPPRPGGAAPSGGPGGAPGPSRAPGRGQGDDE